MDAAMGSKRLMSRSGYICNEVWESLRELENNCAKQPVISAKYMPSMPLNVDIWSSDLMLRFWRFTCEIG